MQEGVKGMERRKKKERKEGRKRGNKKDRKEGEGGEKGLDKSNLQ